VGAAKIRRSVVFVARWLITLSMLRLAGHVTSMCASMETHAMSGEHLLTL